MAEVKEIHIETDTPEPKEKPFAERMQAIGQTALETALSEVEKEIETRTAPIEKTSSTLTTDIKKVVEAVLQSTYEKYEAERQDLWQAEIDRQIEIEVEAATQQLHEQYKESEAEYKAERERLLRTAAEAENTKKRAQIEHENRLEFANQKILEGVIPVLDSMEAAIKSATTQDDPAAFTTFIEGVQLVHKQLLDALKTHGLTPIEAVGETFDPNHHEGLLTAPSTDVPEGKVIEEFRRGYMLNARVLRAAQVVISQGPPEAAADTDPSPEDTDGTNTTE